MTKDEIKDLIILACENLFDIEKLLDSDRYEAEDSITIDNIEYYLTFIYNKWNVELIQLTDEEGKNQTFGINFKEIYKDMNKYTGDLIEEYKYENPNKEYLFIPNDF